MTDSGGYHGTAAGRRIRVRAVLEVVEPEVWRQLDLDASLTLEELHRVLQVAFGWRDSHLHAFAQEMDLPPTLAIPDDARRAHREPRGATVERGWDGRKRLVRYWRDQRSLDDDMPGRPEDGCRVGTVLAKGLPPLEYEYDFGDGWMHRIEWIESWAAEPGEARAVLVRAEGRTPWEDSGGPGGNAEKLEALEQPEHPDHRDTVAWVTEGQGPWCPAHGTPVDAGAVNRELQRWFPSLPGDATPRPEMAVGALTHIMADGIVPEFRMYVERAQAAGRALEPAAVEVAVRPYVWLLDRVGPTGLRLTPAGWLPPQVVVDALADLGWKDLEVGKGSRENQTVVVLHLRHSAMQLGLLRVQKGVLLLTPAGRKVAGDPLALWRYLARAIVDRAGSDVVRDAILFFAVEIAAGRDRVADEWKKNSYAEAIAFGLEVVGWRFRDGSGAGADVAWDCVRGAESIFDNLGAWVRVRGWRSGPVTEVGRAFAREVLAVPAEVARHRKPSIG
jgi:hypothetical protein